MIKKIVFAIIILSCLLIINSLIHSIVDLLNKQTVLTQAQQELKQKKEENAMLKRKLAQAQSPAFVEEEARNKLFLVKPGEQEVIVANITPVPTGTPQSPKKSHWQEWLSLFF
jgi:cell division protein FtsB